MGLKGAVVNHRMELPHILGCQKLFMTAERKECAFPPSVLHWRLHTWGIFLESSCQSLWWSISLFLVVSTLLLSTAGLLTGGLEGRLTFDGTPMNIVEHAPLTNEPLDEFSKKECTSIKSTQIKRQMSPAPPGSLILWTTPPAMVAVTLTFNTRVPAFLFLNFM